MLYTHLPDTRYIRYNRKIWNANKTEDCRSFAENIIFMPLLLLRIGFRTLSQRLFYVCAKVRIDREADVRIGVINRRSLQTTSSCAEIEKRVPTLTT